MSLEELAAIVTIVVPIVTAVTVFERKHLLIRRNLKS
jgi:hypothetical protein